MFFRSKLFLAVVTAVALTGAAVGARAEPAKTVVLVHGAFADGSSWAKVIPLLEAKGLKVVAIQNPLSSLDDDVAATRRAIEQAQGPVVLVGHSWAGMVITQAGDDPKVKSLVYVAAFAPDAGQSLADLLSTAPAPAWASSLIEDSGHFLRLPPKVVLSDFAQDLPAAEARIVAATEGPWAARCQSDRPTRAAWRTRPAWFILTGSDHMIDPGLQARMAAHINATVVRTDASHVVMLSQPRKVADAILAAVQ